MDSQILLGIDLGTGGCKITAINTEGSVMAEASADYPTLHPQPLHSEQNPNDWYRAVIDCIHAIRNKIDFNNILALSIDASTHNAVLLDKDLKVIRPTIMWTDQRSVKEVNLLEQKAGNEIFGIGYQKVTPTWTLPQLLWIKNNEPENFSRIYRVFFVKDYIRFLLTGCWQTDYIDAQGSLLFDVKKQIWSQELCRLVGLQMDVLPPISIPTDIVGTISRSASLETGLQEGTPVVCGTSDVSAEDYGAGALNPGQCIIKLATAGNLNVMTANPVPHEKTLTYSHVVPGLWYTAIATNTAASSMRWFRDTFLTADRSQNSSPGSIYQLMEKEAGKIPAGAEGIIFHPYLMGERAPHWSSSLRAGFMGVTMAHRRGHFIRSIMEGVAFSLKDCCCLAEEIGLNISELILIGGGAKSKLWAQILCDVFGKKITRPKVTDASFGTALIAGVGIGVFKDFSDAANRCIQKADTLLPNDSNHQYYEKQFKYYQEITAMLKKLYQNMNK